MILPFFSLSKHQNKAEFKKLYGSEVFSSDFPGLKTYAVSMVSTASTTSVASMTFTASFHQKNYWSWWLDTPCQPNHQYWSFFVEWIIKNPNFYWYLYFFCRKLLRSADIVFSKTGWWNSNIQISRFQKHLQTYSSLHISIFQSQFIKCVSIWDTLYQNLFIESTQLVKKNLE